MSIWNEWQHPRDANGRFISKDQALAGGSGYIRAPRTQHLLHGAYKGFTEGFVQGAADASSKAAWEGFKEGYQGKNVKVGRKTIFAPAGNNKWRNAVFYSAADAAGAFGAGALEGGVKGAYGGAIHGAWRGHKAARQQAYHNRNRRRAAKAAKAVEAAKTGVKKAKRTGRRGRA